MNQQSPEHQLINRLNNSCVKFNFCIYVIVIPQYEYNILVITQVRGEAEDKGNN